MALIGEDFIETGWSRDPSKRSEAYKTLNIEVAPLVTERSTDPMSTPPPAHLAEDQLAEFRSLMARPKGETPPSD